MKLALALAVLAVLSACSVQAFKPCAPRMFKQDSYVCVCNADYCDDLDLPPPSTTSNVVAYTSDKEGQRFSRREFNFTQSHDSKSNVKITLDPSQKFQTILGFGGAFTDAAGINIRSLEEPLQEEILKAYYSPSGLEYSIGRVPMASCDFSTREYSYEDVKDDFDLTHFNLTEEDLEYKIPLIQKAKEMSRKPLLLLGSPWSSPAWMKTNEKMIGRGALKPDPKYHQAWAKYFVKFLQAYEEHGLPFWGLTTQNEPLNGMIVGFSFQCLGFTADTQRDFVADFLGPTLKASGFGVDKIKLMIADEQRLVLPGWAKTVLEGNTTEYVSGIAFHWYLNLIASSKLLDKTHEMFPDKFILATEACYSAQPWDVVSLGNWQRAEGYAIDIMDDLQHWSVGWVDWNLALDMTGGPNWVNNKVDAPVIVNADKGEFYKQPMYYALAHFSKFIPPGSVRIDSTLEGVPLLYSLNAAAFLTPDNSTVLVVVNAGIASVDVNVHDPSRGDLNFTLKPHSFTTLTW